MPLEIYHSCEEDRLSWKRKQEVRTYVGFGLARDWCLQSVFFNQSEFKGTPVAEVGRHSYLSTNLVPSVCRETLGNKLRVFINLKLIKIK